MKKKIIVAIIIFISTEQHTFAQMVVTDPKRDIADGINTGKIIAETGKTVTQLKKQYEKMKDQYELAKRKVDNLKKVSQSIINFTSSKSFMKDLQRLIGTVKDCGKSFFDSPLVPQEYKTSFKKELKEKLDDQADLTAELELVNSVDGPELSDSDRLRLALRTQDKAKTYRKELEAYNERLNEVLEIFERKAAWKKAKEKIYSMSLWNPDDNKR